LQVARQTALMSAVAKWMKGFVREAYLKHDDVRIRPKYTPAESPKLQLRKFFGRARSKSYYLAVSEIL
jgi:hypothetical protein